MIGIINYGLGNLLAFKNSFELLGKSSKILNYPHEFENCTHFVLPGVGSFDYAIECLKNSNIYKSVERSVFVEKKPILGVCSGMQIMFQRSEEGVKSGLGWIEGEVVKFSDNFMMHDNLPIPHIGWNKLNIKSQNKINLGIREYEFYFLHSFFCSTKDINVEASSFYGVHFPSIVNKDNIYGTQFHPEKSHEGGLKLLLNFSNI